MFRPKNTFIVGSVMVAFIGCSSQGEHTAISTPKDFDPPATLDCVVVSEQATAELASIADKVERIMMSIISTAPYSRAPLVEELFKLSQSEKFKKLSEIEENSSDSFKDDMTLKCSKPISKRIQTLSDNVKEIHNALILSIHAAPDLFGFDVIGNFAIPKEALEL